jgi:hypothetical protein
MRNLTARAFMKFAVYDLGKSEKLIAEGAVERIGLLGGSG